MFFWRDLGLGGGMIEKRRMRVRREGKVERLRVCEGKKQGRDDVTPRWLNDDVSDKLV